MIIPFGKLMVFDFFFFFRLFCHFLTAHSPFDL